MKTQALLAGIAAFSLLATASSFAQQEAIDTQQESFKQGPTTTEPTRSPVEAPSTLPADQEVDKPKMVQPTTPKVEEAEPASQRPITLAPGKPTQQDTMISSNSIVGATVKNAQGEEFGEIVELMIDPQSGTVKQAVLNLSGGWLTSAKRVALPWETLKVGLGKDDLVLEIDKEYLSNAPEVVTNR